MSVCCVMVCPFQFDALLPVKVGGKLRPCTHGRLRFRPWELMRMLGYLNRFPLTLGNAFAFQAVMLLPFWLLAGGLTCKRPAAVGTMILPLNTASQELDVYGLVYVFCFDV